MGSDYYVHRVTFREVGMKKSMWLRCISLFMILLCACTGKKADGLYTIGMVQITEDPMLDLARNSVIVALKEEGFEEGKNIRIEYENAQGEIPNITLILKKFIAQKVNMVITNSTPCMAAAAHTVKDIPVVFTVAFSPEQIGIKDAPANLTGAYDPFQMGGFVRLMLETVPALQKIGILCNSSEPNARYGADRLKEECARQNIEVVEVAVFSSNDVLQGAQALAQKGVQAFAIAADNTVYLAMDALAKVADSQKIPLFVTEPSQVERGACAGMGIDFKEWGRESGKIAAAVIKGESPANIPIKALQHKILYLNVKAAVSQNVMFPPELIAKADVVMNRCVPADIQRTGR
jgi:putative tryptophan/tyrosine transport system substrate-binding protein